MGNDDKNYSKKKDQIISEETENLVKEEEHIFRNNEKENLLELKKSTDKLFDISSEETFVLTNLVNSKEIEIKDLKNDEILLERNEIQIDIQKNQQLLIDEYKKNNDELKLNLGKLKIKAEELNNSNRKFLVNNNEIKDTLNRHIKHNKNLQTSINELKKIQSEFLESKSQFSKMKDQIKFYQDDNIRLSSSMNDIQKKHDIIKDNFNKTEKEKNDIFLQIQDLNNSLLKNNIIGSPFLKEKIEESSINSKVLNDITDSNLKNIKTSNINKDNDKDLNILIDDIFK